MEHGSSKAVRCLVCRSGEFLTAYGVGSMWKKVQKRGGTFYGKQQTWTGTRVAEGKTWWPGRTRKVWPRILLKDWKNGWRCRQRETGATVLRRYWKKGRRLYQESTWFGILFQDWQRRWQTRQCHRCTKGIASFLK